MRRFFVVVLLALATSCAAPEKTVVFEAPKPSLPAAPDGADLLLISKAGEDVPSLEAHAANGKVTVFDFYADWCVPCRHVDSYVYDLLKTREDVAYRKINIVSWETPVAKRYLAEVPALPYVIVYGRDGKRIRDIAGLDVDALDQMISEASR